ncbi:MAG TPA: protein kinase, partial [Allocoleopsis sp.]
QILKQTGGQPLLTQKLCKLVANCGQYFQDNLVNNIVEAKIIEKWESQDEPQHLRTLRDRILMSKKVRLLLETYQEILRLGEIPYLDITEHLELRLTGLVINDQGKLKVYNPIYRQVFDQKWVNEQLGNIQQTVKSQIKRKAIAIIDGRYALIEEISKNTLIATYKGQDLHLPHQPFVVVKKFINNGSNKHRVLEREANILSRLNHPNIPKILAYFAENNQFYIVSEYIEGRTLAEDLTENILLSEDRVIDLLKDVLETLKFIHSNDVIHRNIEPENLIIRESDKKIVLIYFGTAKTWENEQSNSTMNLETKGYNRPEEVYGNPNFTSDIYALGMIAIQCLTGIVPIDLPTTQNSEVIWREYAKVSNKLADIIDKMVRYHYQERYQSVDEVLQDLDQSKTAQISINNLLYLPKVKLNNWVKWILMSGGVLSLFVICFMSVSKIFQSSPPVAPSPLKIEKNHPQNYVISSAKEEDQIEQLKQQEAIINVISGWLNAQKTIFAYPYNLEEAKKWTTNKRYDEIKQFVNFLKNNNISYKVEKLEIQKIDFIKVTNNQAKIQGIIEKKSMVYFNEQKGNPEKFKAREDSVQKILYTLKLVNNQWKIDDVKLIKEIK